MLEIIYTLAIAAGIAALIAWIAEPFYNHFMDYFRRNNKYDEE